MLKYAHLLLLKKVKIKFLDLPPKPEPGAAWRSFWKYSKVKDMFASKGAAGQSKTINQTDTQNTQYGLLAVIK